MPQDNEKLKLLHSALSKDEVFNEVVPENYNEFLSVYSDPEKLRLLHSAMSKDEVFRDVVPTDLNEAIRLYGLGKPSAPAGASSVPAGGGVSPVPSVSGGGAGVQIPEGGTAVSADGVVQVPQMPDSLISEQERQEFGLKPGEEQQTDRQRQAEEVKARDQRIGREKEATLAFMRNNIGAELSEKILRNQPLTVQEGKDLREMAVKSGVQGWVDVVDRMSLNSPRDAVRDFMLGADGKAAKFGSVDAFDTIVAENDKSEIIQTGQKRYAEVVGRLNNIYRNPETVERVMRNEEQGMGFKYLSDPERKLAELISEYNDLLKQERPNKARLFELQSEIDELSQGASGTLYDPVTGGFLSGNELPDQETIEFNDEVSSLTKEYSSGKTPYQVLLDMRRQAYFSMQAFRSRYEEAERNMVYGKDSPAYRREVAPVRETYREALKQFLALNRALELNIDPAADVKSGFGEGLARGLQDMLIPKFMEGSPDQLLEGKTGLRSLQTRRDFAEGFADAFRGQGLPLTPGQEELLQYSFSEQAGQAIGSTFGIAVKMMAMSYGVNKIKYVVELPKYARAFQAIMGEKFGNTGKVAARVTMAIGNMGEGSIIYSSAGSNVFQGAGERASDMLYHRLTGMLFKGDPASRLSQLFFQMGRTATGVGGQVTAEYVGQFVTNLAMLGIGNWEEIVETTFGSTGDEGTDKLLLTILAVLPLQGAGDLGKFLAIGFRSNLEAAMKRFPNNAAVQEAMALIEEVETGNNPAFQSPADAVATVGAAAKAELEADRAAAIDAAPAEVKAEVAPEGEAEAEIERRRKEELEESKDYLQEQYSVSSNQTVEQQINAKYDAELAALRQGKAATTEAEATKVGKQEADGTIQKDEQGNFIPKKYTLNRRGENPAPNISLSAISEESFGGDVPTNVKQVKLLEIRGKNSSGQTVGEVWIQKGDRQSYTADVIFNDAELVALRQGKAATTEAEVTQVGKQEVEAEAAVTPEAEVSEAGLGATVNPALESVEATASALDGKTDGVIKEPTAERKFDDISNGRVVTFAYENESEVPLALRDKVSSSSDVNGRQVIRVTLSESEAQYLLNKDNAQAISEAYHSAKSKPEASRSAEDVSLIESVESVLTPKTEVDAVQEQVTAEGVVGKESEVSEGVGVQVAEGGEVAGEGVTEAQVQSEAEAEVTGVQATEAVTTAPATTESQVEVARGVTKADVDAARTRNEKAEPTKRVETVEGEGVVLYERVTKDGKREYKAKAGSGRPALISKADYEARVSQVIANKIAMERMGVKPVAAPKLNTPQITFDEANLTNAATNAFVDSEGNVEPQVQAAITEDVDALTESAMRAQDGEVDASEVDAVPDTVFSPSSRQEGASGKDAVSVAQKKYEDAVKRIKELRKRHAKERQNLGAVMNNKEAARRAFELHQELFALAEAFFELQGLKGNKIGALKGFAQYESDVRKAYGKDLEKIKGASSVIRYSYDVAMAQAMAQPMDPSFQASLPVDAADLAAKLSGDAKGDALIEATAPMVFTSKLGSNLASIRDGFVAAVFNRATGLKSMVADVSKKLKSKDAMVSLENFMGAVARWRDYDTRVKLKWQKFSRDVYGGLNAFERQVLDLAIMSRSILSLESEIQGRIDAVSKFDSSLSDAVDASGQRAVLEGSKKGFEGALRRLALGRQTAKEDAAWTAVASAMNIDVSQLRSRLTSRNLANKRNDEVLGGRDFIDHGRYRSASGVPVTLDAEYAQRFMDALGSSEKYKNIRERVMPRVETFFGYQNSLLLAQRENGSVSEALYNSLVNRNYITRSFTNEDATFLEEAGIVPKGSFTGTQAGSMKFRTLKGGSDGFINMNTQALAYMNTAITYRRIARQGALRSFALDVVPLLAQAGRVAVDAEIAKAEKAGRVAVDAEIAKAEKAGKYITPEQVAMLQYANTRGYVQRMKGRNEFGEPVFETLSPMMSRALSDAVAYDLTDASGNPIRVYIGKDIVADIDVYSKGNRDIATVGKVMSLALGTAIMKIQATGMNSIYAVMQLMADSGHRATASDAYYKSFTASMLTAMYGGASRTVVDVSQRIYNTAVGLINNDLKVRRKFEVEFEDAVEHGFNMMTLVGEAFINPAKSLMGAKFGNTAKVIDLIGYLPEVTEIAGRLDVYTRLTKRYVAQFRKKNNGQNPDAAQLRKMKEDAAQAANNVMNYAVTGSAKPIIEPIAPFYSAAMAAWRGQVTGAKKQGYAAYSMKIAEMIGVATLIAVARKQIEEEDRKNNVGTGVPVQMAQRGFYIAANVVDGKRNYVHLPTMANIVTGMTLTAGELIADVVLGRSSDDALIEGQVRVQLNDFLRVFATMGPFGSPGAGPPVAISRSILMNNYHPFFGNKVWQGNPNILPYMQADPKTYVMFQQLARLLPDDSPFGAKQLQEATSSILVGNNPLTVGLYSSVDMLLGAMGYGGTPGVGTKTKSPLDAVKNAFYREARDDFRAGREALAKSEPKRREQFVGSMSENMKNATSELVERIKKIAEEDKRSSEVVGFGYKYGVDVVKEFKNVDEYLYYLGQTRLRFMGDSGSYSSGLYQVVAGQGMGRYDMDTVEQLAKLMDEAGGEGVRAQNLMNSIIYMGLFDPDHSSNDEKGFMGAMYRLDSNFDATALYQSLNEKYRTFTRGRNDFRGSDDMISLREQLQEAAEGEGWAKPDDIGRMTDKLVDVLFVIKLMGDSGGIFD
jgi:hypothetical protein